MRNWHSCVGLPIASLETPVLLLDLNTFDCNNRQMHQLVEQRKVTWRAHAKAHKSSALAVEQVKSGAIGVLVQKLGEAEVMVAGGVKDVYISNEIIDERKLSRLAELHERANVSLAVDSMLGLSRLADALRKRGSRKRLPVLIDVNVGHDRCGCSVDEAIVLAQAIVMGYCKDVIEFRGIHCYHGSVQHVRSAEERAESARKVSLLARQARDAMIAAVGSCNVVTGGGTGTFATDLECEVFTELQPGSYAFGDVDYGMNEGFYPWHQALLVQTMIMSGGKSRSVCDAGNKCHSLDAGVEPKCTDNKLVWKNGGDEHGILLRKTEDAALPQLGDLVYLVPGHVDPTFALWDYAVTHRNGIVAGVVAIDARNRSD